MWLFKKKKETVIGKIIRFDIIDNKHYPVFAFTTLDGKYLELRNVPRERDVAEASVEDIYNEQGAETKLSEALPITDISIKYVIDDPTDFIAMWI